MIMDFLKLHQLKWFWVTPIQIGVVL